MSDVSALVRSFGSSASGRRMRWAKALVTTAVTRIPRRPAASATARAWAAASPASGRCRTSRRTSTCRKDVRLAGYFGDAVDLLKEAFQEILDAVTAGQLIFPVDRDSTASSR